jgi:hypothetical protein
LLIHATNGKDDDSWKPGGGVRHVKANPVTGNVLILYEPDTISQDQIGGALQGLGCLRRTGNARTMMRRTIEPLDGLSDALLDTLVRAAMELALQSASGL